MQVTSANIDWPEAQIAAFCERWKISKLWLFGSVLREDFRRDSDIDVLYVFKPEAQWSLFDVMEAKDELTEILGRSVDLVSRTGIERSRNWVRRRAILDSAKIVYAADS